MTTLTTLPGTYEYGDVVDDFELPTTAGGAVRLSDFLGRPVLIFFTTTWCPYCGAEAPYLEQEIWQRYRSRGLQVLSIQVKEGAALASSFAERYAWTFPVLVDERGEVSQRFAPEKEGLSSEVAIINAHFVLDNHGRVVYRDFLNMERFDAKAVHVRAFLDEMLGTQGDPR
jgi:peroxiredoxin